LGININSTLVLYENTFQEGRLVSQDVSYV
jgi:hypothetical protein